MSRRKYGHKKKKAAVEIDVEIEGGDGGNGGDGGDGGNISQSNTATISKVIVVKGSFSVSQSNTASANGGNGGDGGEGGDGVDLG